MEKYRLLIDCTFFNTTNNLNSIDHYTVQLIRGFSEGGIFQVFALISSKNQYLLDELVGFEVPKIVIGEECRYTPWRWVDRLLGMVPFRKELDKRNINVTLMPFSFYCNYFFNKKYHQHLIVHDLIPYYTLRANMAKYKYFIWCFLQKVLASKVNYYISISENTRKELKQFVGKDSEVVYNSLPFDFSVKENVVECMNNKPYILYVSRFEKYKNAETLIRAFSLIMDRIPHLLYLKGDMHQPDDYMYLKKIVSDLQLTDRVVLDNQFRTEGEMRYLYCHANLFVHPSLYEGFGWTPIEAAVLETPVLVSNIDVLKEVTCGKVPMFDPNSPEELSCKMLEILRDPPSDKAKEELKNFYLKKYSLKNQIERMTEVILHNIKSSR